MKLTYNPPIDERLQLAQYKAGYYAFFTTFAILLVLGMGWTLFPEHITVAVMYMTLFFPGTLVFLVVVARAGLFAFIRDTNNSSPRQQRMALLVLCIQTLFFSTMMGLSHHYIPLDDRTPTVQESVMYAAGTGLFWGLGMGALYVFRLRRNREKEEEE